MRVAMVCPASVHGVVGGAERLWEGLVDAINRETEHTAELISVPAPEDTVGDLIASYRAFDRLHLDDVDVVITGKYPAWMVRHDRHIVHMCHPLRGLYDTYPTSFPARAEPTSAAGRRLVGLTRSLGLAEDWTREAVLNGASRLLESVPADHPDLAFPGPLARELVRWLDAHALHPSRISSYFAISPTVAQRPGYFPAGANVGVAVPPTGLDGLHRGPYRSIFTASRLDAPKRVDLLIDAMRYVTGRCELRIAGSGPAERALREKAYHDPRIVFLGRLSDDELVEEYANALVVPFVPKDEDLGLITLEAQLSHKPVVTCTDSGGVVDLVAHGADGLVVAPAPRELGAAISRFVLDPPLAEAMGDTGAQHAREITWRRLVNQLLSPQPASEPTRTSAGRILVLSTYAADPAFHGGQVRENRLMRRLGQRFDVHYIAVTEPENGVSGQIAPGVWQSIVQPPHESRVVEGHIAAGATVPVGDVAALLSARVSGELRQIVTDEVSRSDAVVLVHPYLYPLVRDLDPHVPLIYDSHNAEWSLKRAMYPRTGVGDALAAAVAEVEAATVRRASLITVVSDDDATKLEELASTMGRYAVIPNGADVADVVFVTGEDRRVRRTRWLDQLKSHGWPMDAQEVVLFMGSGHPPNIVAAKAVLRLARDLPQHLFVLIGSHVDELRPAPTESNVLARGVVAPEELRLLLSLCSVAVNPMATGSGTNVKMLDYFASGAPSISTTIGARGLDAVHGRDLLLADEHAGFLDAIVSLTSDRARADTLASAARMLAAPFDWALLGEQFADEVEATVLARREMLQSTQALQAP